MSSVTGTISPNSKIYAENYTSAYENAESKTISSGRTWSWLDVGASATFVASVAAPLLVKDKTTLTVSAILGAGSCVTLAISLISKSIASSEPKPDSTKNIETAESSVIQDLNQTARAEYEELVNSIIKAKNELIKFEDAKQKILDELDVKESVTSILEQSKTARKEIDEINKLIIECQNHISAIENKLKNLKKGEDYKQIETKIREAQQQLEKREKQLEEAMKARDSAKKLLEQTNDKQKSFNKQIDTLVRNLDDLQVVQQNLIIDRDELIMSTDLTDKKLQEAQESVKSTKSVLQDISTEELFTPSSVNNKSATDEKQERYFEKIDNN